MKTAHYLVKFGYILDSRTSLAGWQIGNELVYRFIEADSEKELPKDVILKLLQENNYRYSFNWTTVFTMFDEEKTQEYLMEMLDAVNVFVEDKVSHRSTDLGRGASRRSTV